jgi:hypothetical protein
MVRHRTEQMPQWWQHVYMTTFSVSVCRPSSLTTSRFRATSARFLALPFDTMRAQYAAAVDAGIVERSLIASGRFERMLGMLERFLLGPLARRV